MDRIRDKKSVFRLLAFIAIISGLYLLCLQLAGLLHRYMRKDKHVSFSLSEEDVPIPAVIVCAETDSNLKKDLLQTYNLELLSLARKEVHLQEDITDNWKNFDWGKVDLKKLYEEVVLFPFEDLRHCTIGENYTCTEMEGPFHRWTNRLSRTDSCSILTTSLRVPIGHITHLQVDFDSRLFRHLSSYVKRQYNRIGFSHYFHKYLYDVPTPLRGITRIQQLNVEKHAFVSDEQACSKDDNVIKCKEECVEAHLMEGNDSCVLPWMMSSGPTCDSLEAAQRMIEKELQTVELDCDCIPPCAYYQYINEAMTSARGNEFYGFIIIIKNTVGVVSFHEDYLYYFLDLLANCGGCISVFGTFSLLWIIEKIIEASFSIAKTETIKCLGKWKNANVKKYMMWLAAASCYFLFFYQAYGIVTAFLKNSITLKIDRLPPQEAPVPAVVICNGNGNEEFIDIVVHEWYYTLGEDYKKQLYETPRRNMIRCLVDGKSCMKDKGSNFYWKTLYFTSANCDVMIFRNDNNSSRPTQFTAYFKRISSSYEFYWQLSLADEATIPKYDILKGLRLYQLSNNFRGRVTYDITVHHHLPPCTDNYQACIDKCWETAFLKEEDLCTPPQMPASVKDRRCHYLFELIDLESYIITNIFEENRCNCLPPCTSMEIEKKNGIERDNSVTAKTELQIALLPLRYTKVTEELSFTTNAFVAEIGGILGVLTGASFLEILLAALTMVIHLNKKIASRFSALTLAIKTCLNITAYGFFLFRAYSVMAEFAQDSVHVIQEVNFDTDLVLPDIIVCDLSPRLFYTSKLNLTAGSPGGFSVVTSVENSDIWKYWNYYDYHLFKKLGVCDLFGTSCAKKQGELYEWKQHTQYNGYCSKLHIRPLNLNNFLSNKIELSFGSDIQVYLTHEEDTYLDILQLQGDNLLLSESEIKFYDLIGNRYDLQEEKLGNCNNEKGYSRNKCLGKCLNDHLIKTYGCYFPWMDNVTNLDVCRSPTDYMYKSRLDVSLLAQCNCTIPCHYTEYTAVYSFINDHLSGVSSVVLVVQDTETVTKEVWAYTGSQLVAELGGLMSLFTGLTLYDIVFFEFGIFGRINRN